MSRRVRQLEAARPGDLAAPPPNRGLALVLLVVLPALVLFACVWVTRVFASALIVTGLLQMIGLRAIALVATLGGLLPSLPLGIAYGLICPAPVYRRALAVAALAVVFELGFASLTVPWWSFFTWWVLPVEGLTVLILFPLCAWIGARLFARTSPVARRRVGVTIFVALALCAIALPWVVGQGWL